MCVQGGVSVGAVDVAPIQDQEVGWAEQGQQETENVQSNSDAEVGSISIGIECGIWYRQFLLELDHIISIYSSL